MPRNQIENPDNPEEHNTNWMDTHIRLSNDYFLLLKQLDRRPSTKELSKISGFSESNISKHLKFIKKISFKERFEDLCLLTDRVILAQGLLGASGGQGSTAAAKLFLEAVENIGADDKSKTGLGNLSGEELEKHVEDMKKVLNGNVVNFVRRTPGSGGGATGTNSESV